MKNEFIESCLKEFRVQFPALSEAVEYTGKVHGINIGIKVKDFWENKLQLAIGQGKQEERESLKAWAEKHGGIVKTNDGGATLVIKKNDLIKKLNE